MCGLQQRNVTVATYKEKAKNIYTQNSLSYHLLSLAKPYSIERMEPIVCSPWKSASWGIKQAGKG